MGHQSQIDLPEEMLEGATSVHVSSDAGHGAVLGLRRAITEIDAVPDRDAILARAPAALCANTLFERAIVSLVDRSQLNLVSLHFDGDSEYADVVQQFWNADPPQLTHLLVESEVIRRGRAILVVDALHHPRTVSGRLGDEIRSESYVAAPIVRGGRAIGMVHADRKKSGAPVDAGDADALWLFCQAVSLACERAELTARLGEQREEVRRHLDALSAALDSAQPWGPSQEPSLAPLSDMHLAAAGVVLAPETRMAKLLTAREFDVLKLMAEGQTNAEIAAELVITEGTVKTHVKHVLRKLRAGNRVEAVSRYLRILGSGQPAG